MFVLFRRNRNCCSIPQGQGLVEYALLLALIAVVALAALTVFSDSFSTFADGERSLVIGQPLTPKAMDTLPGGPPTYDNNPKGGKDTAAGSG